MKKVTFALVQHGSPVGEKGKNLDTAIAWSKKGKQAGASLVCFPELNITGHAGHPTMVSEAEEVPDGPAVRSLIDAAAELDIFIGAGIAEYDRGVHYNTYILVGPGGYVGKQRKVHLSRDEYLYFRGGTSLPVFDLPFAKVGINICYDNEVPEVSRCLAVSGAELVVCPHAARFGSWPDSVKKREKTVREQKAHWKLVHSCRAWDNGFYVALCNTAGRSADILDDVEANHAGCCMVFDPYGKCIAESQATDIADEMVVTSLDPELFKERRREPCFNLQTRRPEVFGVLSEPTE
jgi:N-carbamoylputrescine amidase